MMDPLDRLTVCALVPSVKDDRDWIFLPEAHDVGAVQIGDFWLDKDASLRVQVGPTCVGNAIAKALEILLKRAALPCDDTISGTGLWSEGQLYGGLHGVDPSRGTQPRFVLQAARDWGWPSRALAPEEPLVELGAAALGEITARTLANYRLAYELIQGEFLGLGDPCDNLETALRSGHVIVAAGQVDKAFAAAAPGDALTAPTGALGGHGLAIDSVQREGAQRLWGILDSWGRGIGEGEPRRRRLWGTDAWIRSRWELRALRLEARVQG